MKKFVFTAFLFFSLLSFGQEYKTVFYDSLGIKSEKDTNYRKIVFEKNDESYKISTYLKGKLSLVRIVEDTINFNKNMVENQYFENGQISKTSKYIDNKLDGYIVEFYENGAKKTVYTTNLEKNSDVVFNIKEFWDKEGNQKVKDGTGVYEFKIDLGYKYIETNLSGNVINGLMEGKFSSNPNKFPYFEEYYSKGKLLNGVRKISNSVSKYYTEISTHPKPMDGMNEFRNMIGSKIKTKKQKTPLTGTIVARFYVDTNGKIQNPFIIKSLNPYFDNQLIEVLKNAESWTPGNYRGVNVITYYTLPVGIKVEESY